MVDVYLRVGHPRADGKLPNTTGVAFSDDAGQSFYYRHETPILKTDRPWIRRERAACSFAARENVFTCNTPRSVTILINPRAWKPVTVT